MRSSILKVNLYVITSLVAVCLMLCLAAAKDPSSPDSAFKQPEESLEKGESREALPWNKSDRKEEANKTQGQGRGSSNDSLFQSVGEDEHRIGLFIKAAREGDLEQVKKLIKDGVKVNAKNMSGDTALMAASEHGRMEVARFLLSQGADIKAQNNRGHTAITIAVKNGHNSLVVFLAKQGKVKPAVVLQQALIFSNLSLAKPLLALVKPPISGSYLVAACRSGNVDVVKAVLDKGADLNAGSGMPLMNAIGTSAPLEVVRLLIDRGAKVNLSPPGLKGKTPIRLACHYNRVDVIKLLLENGAYINSQAEDGTTGLMETALNAQQGPSFKTFKLLVENGSDLQVRDKRGFTVLHYACGVGRADMVSILLDKGARIDATGKDDLTPLMIAAHQGHAEVAKLLLERKAKVDLRTQKGRTALMRASMSGHAEAVKVLLDHGADVNASDKIGATSLMYAASNGHAEAVEALLQKGAKVDLKMKRGLTAMDLARKEGHREVMNVLRKHGG